MGSVRFDGIVFFAYTNDHPPPHVHAGYGALIVIESLLPGGGVAVADRHDSLSRKAKRNEVRRVMRCAELNEAALRTLWKETHELPSN